MQTFIFLAFFFSSILSAKEIALTFDDAPVTSSVHHDTYQRTEILVKKLKDLQVPQVMVFANPCRREDTASVLNQLKLYIDNGHFIGNHTCSHPRLDDVGYDVFSKDAEKGDLLLAPFFKKQVGQKFLRFPYLNESLNETLRDQMRNWLKTNQYRNGMVSIDNDDYLVSFKINKAKSEGRKIDYEKVKTIFLNHLLGAVEFYDSLAIRTLGYSPKHVLLLHEMDATVMYIDALINELRARGWKIIGTQEAFQDKLYLENPKNTYANNGIISQVAFEKTGIREGYYKFNELQAELDKILLQKKQGR